MRKSVFTEHHGAKTGVFPPGALWGLGAQSETREQAWGTRRPWSAWHPQLTGAHRTAASLGIPRGLGRYCFSDN